MKTQPRLLSVSLAAVLSVSLLSVQPASALTVFDPSCWRRPKFDPPCRLNFDPGLGAGIG